MNIPEEAKIAQVLHDLLLAMERWRDRPEQWSYEARELRLRLEDTATWELYGQTTVEAEVDA